MTYKLKNTAYIKRDSTVCFDCQKRDVTSHQISPRWCFEASGWTIKFNVLPIMQNTIRRNNRSPPTATGPVAMGQEPHELEYLPFKFRDPQKCGLTHCRKQLCCFCFDLFLWGCTRMASLCSSVANYCLAAFPQEHMLAFDWPLRSNICIGTT